MSNAKKQNTGKAVIYHDVLQPDLPLINSKTPPQKLKVKLLPVQPAALEPHEPRKKSVYHTFIKEKRAELLKLYPELPRKEIFELARKIYTQEYKDKGV